MNESQAYQLWAKLGAEGKAPAHAPVRRDLPSPTFLAAGE